MDTGTGAALAWSPGAASQPPPGLGVKLGSLVVLLLLPLACGLAPLWCFRQPPGTGGQGGLGGSGRIRGVRGIPGSEGGLRGSEAPGEAAGAAQGFGGGLRGFGGLGDL